MLTLGRRAAMKSFEAQRWPRGAFHARCASANVYPMMSPPVGRASGKLPLALPRLQPSATVGAGTIIGKNLVRTNRADTELDPNIYRTRLDW